MTATNTGPGEDLGRILDFLILIDRFKTIERRAYVADGSRRETDAEHVWHLAMYALLLEDAVGLEVDIGHVLKLILVHDLVEIHAGDTYAYDEVAGTDQDAREREAADRLFGTLPAELGTRLHAWWREFEDAATPEGRFAKALDRLQGFAQNYVAGGKAWRENGIDRARTYQRTALPLATDPALAALVEEIYARADREGLWGDRRRD